MSCQRYVVVEVESLIYWSKNKGKGTRVDCKDRKLVKEYSEFKPS